MKTIKDKISRYPGMRAYESREEELFFGRDQEVYDLLNYIKVKPLVVLFSRSGLGKSSLINTKLVKELTNQEDNAGHKKFLPIKIRLQSLKSNDDAYFTPVETVKNAFKECPDITLDEEKLKEMTDKSSQEASLWEYFNACNSNGIAPVLIFDQFEELFSNDIDVQKKFTRDLSELVDNLPPKSVKDKFRSINRKDIKTKHSEWYQPNPIKVLIAIRSNRLSELDKLSEIIPSILTNRFRLQSFNDKKAEMAIEAPSSLEDENGEFASQPFTFSEKAKSEILTKIKNDHNDKIDPLFLQLFCFKIEELIIKKGGNKVTPELYGGVPGLEKLVDNHYNAAIEKLETKKERKEARKLIEEKMVIGGRRVLIDEQTILNEISPELLKKLVEDLKLLRKENIRKGTVAYEVGHDALVDAIEKSFKSRKDKTIESLEKENETVNEFNKLLEKFILLAGVIIFIGLVGLAIYLNRGWSNADDNTQKSEQQRALEIARNYSFTDATKSFGYAQDAYAKDPTDIDIKRTLLKAYNGQNYIQFYQLLEGKGDRDNDNINSIAFNYNNTKLLSTSTQGNVFLWSIGKGISPESKKLGENEIISQAIFFENHDLVATVVNKSIIRIFDYNGEKKLEINPLKEEEKSTLTKKIISLSINSEGNKLLIGVKIDSNKKDYIQTYNLNIPTDNSSQASSELLKSMELKDNIALEEAKFINKDYFYVLGSGAINFYDKDFNPQRKKPLPGASTAKLVKINPIYDNDSILVITTYKNVIYAFNKKGQSRYLDVNSKGLLKEKNTSLSVATMSGNNKFIVSGAKDNRLIFRENKGKMKRNGKNHLLSEEFAQPKKHRSNVTQVIFSPESNIVASTSEDRTVRLWDVKGNELQVIQGLKNYSTNTQIAFSNNKDEMFALSDGLDIRLCFFKDDPIKVFSLNDNEKESIKSISYVPAIDTTVKSKILIASSNRILSYDFPDFSNEKEISSFNNTQELKKIKTSPLQQNLLLAFGEKMINVIDYEKDELILNIDNEKYPSNFCKRKEKKGGNFDVSFFLDSKLISANEGYSTRLWSDSSNYQSLLYYTDPSCDSTHLDTTSTWNSERYRIQQIGYLPNKNKEPYYYFIRLDHTVFLMKNTNMISTWEEYKNIRIDSLHNKDGHKETIHSINFFMDREKDTLQFILTGSYDNSAILWNKKGQILAKLQTHYNDVLSADFSPDGKYIITGSADGTIKIWTEELIKKEGAKKKEKKWVDILTLDENQGTNNQQKIQQVGFSSDGKHIYYFNNKNEVKIKSIELEIKEILEEVEKLKIFKKSKNQ